MKKKGLIIIGILLVLVCGTLLFWLKPSLVVSHQIGDKIDSLDGVYVYYNGKTGNISGRNTKDGYNLGLKYQCVEFVKRYYFEHYKHRMPNSYGNAIDFFNPKLKDGQINVDRNLVQFTNPSKSQPQKGDLLIYDKTIGNSFGHVAIVAEVEIGKIQIIQQNPGAYGDSRKWFDLTQNGNESYIENKRILGWLRMKN